MAKQLINLCMISDDQYAIFTGVALTSLRQNRNLDTQYNIYILSDEISKENQTRLEKLDDTGFTIFLIEVSGFGKYRASLSIEGISAKPAALYKFMIPRILSDLDDVLYVDGDVVFFKDLAELYSDSIFLHEGGVLCKSYS